MAFKSNKQRKAFFASSNFQRSANQPEIIVFSYRTPNKKLGKFKNLKEVFTRFPSEKKAFQRVIKFRKTTGIRVNTIEDIKKEKRKNNVNVRWDK